MGVGVSPCTVCGLCCTHNRLPFHRLLKTPERPVFSRVERMLTVLGPWCSRAGVRGVKCRQLSARWGLGVVLQQDPGPEGPTTTGGGCRNGDSRPVAHGAGGPQRPGGADQAGVRSGSALLFEVRLDDAHRLNRTPPDRGDREDPASLRTVGRALGSCPDVDTRRGGGLRPESRPNGGSGGAARAAGPPLDGQLHPRRPVHPPIPSAVTL